MLHEKCWFPKDVKKRWNFDAIFMYHEMKPVDASENEMDKVRQNGL